LNTYEAFVRIEQFCSDRRPNETWKNRYRIDNSVRYWSFDYDGTIVVSEESAIPTFAIILIDNPVYSFLRPSPSSTLNRNPRSIFKLLFTRDVVGRITRTLQIRRIVNECLGVKIDPDVRTLFDLFYHIQYGLALNELKLELNAMSNREFLEFYRIVRYDGQLVELVEKHAPPEAKGLMPRCLGDCP
jgi:hypothetical protein